MKIDELDEWQGLTREMVDHYLNRTGWCNMPDPDQRLLKPQYAHVSFKMGLGATIERIASILGSTPQSMLREINPRMREGVPSEAARQAHPGNWLVSGCLNQSKEMHFEVWHSRNLHLASNYPYNPDGKRIECWPLDEHGSKVRWPTDSEGKML